MEIMNEKGGQKGWDTWYDLRTQLDEAYKVEEEFWSRKSRVEWLQQGDKNTKYFYVVSAQRRKRNIIDR